MALAQELARLRGEPVHVLTTTDDATPTPSSLQDAVLRVEPPSETSSSIGAFLDLWAPDLLLVLGLPERPRLLSEMRKRNRPLFLAATNRGELGGSQRISGLSAGLIDTFDHCLAPSAADARALQKTRMSSERITVAGPLSDTAIALPCDAAVLEQTTARLGGRPVWLAAQITGTEVALMEAAQRRTIRAAHRLLLVIVPRKKSDGVSIARHFSDKGWRVAVQSVGDEANETVQVFVADADDDHGLWYRLAPISVIGGSFDPNEAAIDPYEPAALGSAIVSGIETGDSSRFERLKSAGALVEVTDPDALGETLFSLLSPEKTAKLAHAGWSVTSESAHVVERLANLINDTLDEREFG